MQIIPLCFYIRNILLCSNMQITLLYFYMQIIKLRLYMQNILIYFCIQIYLLYIKYKLLSCVSIYKLFFMFLYANLSICISICKLYCILVVLFSPVFSLEYFFYWPLISLEVTPTFFFACSSIVLGSIAHTIRCVHCSGCSLLFITFASSRFRRAANMAIKRNDELWDFIAKQRSESSR